MKKPVPERGVVPSKTVYVPVGAPPMLCDFVRPLIANVLPMTTVESGGLETADVVVGARVIVIASVGAELAA